ncbi:VanZ family protein [Halospeciosus flavus]|uniref:VanZ family protein n=1 Tax=Halospeciosus flavus TaxID=3032283 RepID=UPI0036236F1C
MVICYFSLLDTVSAPTASPWWDKKLHIVAYAALALVTAYATMKWRGTSLRRNVVLLVVVLGYGVVIELLQAPLPDRYYSPTDMLANTVGTLVVIVWFGIERYIQYRRVSSTSQR